MTGTHPKRGYQSLQLWVILLTPLLVVASATLMYYTGWLNPDTRTNNGDLLEPVVDASAIGVDKSERLWWLITAVRGDCEQACTEQLHWVGQIRKAVGKDRDRLVQKRISDQPDAWSGLPESQQRISVIDDNAEALPMPGDLHLFVMDPLGNIVLRYGPQHSYEEIQDDLEELLTLSTIG